MSKMKKIIRAVKYGTVMFFIIYMMAIFVLWDLTPFDDEKAGPAIRMFSVICMAFGWLLSDARGDDNGSDT